jgi:hypothetical protein
LFVPWFIARLATRLGIIARRVLDCLLAALAFLHSFRHRRSHTNRPIGAISGLF